MENMEKMRNIVETELARTPAMECVWDKIPPHLREDLVDLILQKMRWSYARGYEDAASACNPQGM